MIFAHQAPYQLISSPELPILILSQLRRIEKLVDNLWENRAFYGEVDILAQACQPKASRFAAFWFLQTRALELGFDISTRQASKIGDFLKNAGKPRESAG
jgi:hypothetical protein